MSVPRLFMVPAASLANAALVAFVLYIGGVFVLAWCSNRLLKKRQFLSEYFLGSRSLGLWAFALTFAATSASGGSFTGFPSKIYTHGWILGLWIASYLVVPICTMGFLGKRINQVARISGAITVPDVLRDRFRSRELGWMAVGLIVFFMAFNLVAQFKAGSEILRTLLRDIPLFHFASAKIGLIADGLPWLQGVSNDYLLCLLTFAFCVIAYTTYGGFHAVVWTDVMQGIVMVIGVLILLPLALWQVGGLFLASSDVNEMTPPRFYLIDVIPEKPLTESVRAQSSWLLLPDEEQGTPHLLRIGRDYILEAGEKEYRNVPVVELTSEKLIARQLASLEKEGAVDHAAEALEKVQQQSKPMWLDPALRTAFGDGSRIMVARVLKYSYGDGRRGVYSTGPGPVPPTMPQSPGTIELTQSPIGSRLSVVDEDGFEVLQRVIRSPVLRVAVEAGEYRIRIHSKKKSWSEKQVSVQTGQLTSFSAEPSRGWLSEAQANESESPLPRPASSSGFLPLGLAFSFFFMWAISGTGQPSNMVRLMAFKNTSALRRGIVVVSFYYGMIYFPLVIIFVCARIVLPGMELESDRIMPQMAMTLTGAAGHPWLAGLLIAAPFAAVMSTVDSFLLVISSGLVRDIYQRSINPKVTDRNVKRMSYACTIVVGAAAMLGAMNPPQFLQDIIVYTGSGLAACFLAPMMFGLYAPRATRAGAIAGMGGGFLAHLSMYLAGWAVNGSFYRPWKLAGIDPVVIGLVVSFLAVFLVSRWTPPPDKETVQRYFMTPRRKDASK